jgi:hypothetical protein
MLCRIRKIPRRESGENKKVISLFTGTAKFRTCRFLFHPVSDLKKVDRALFRPTLKRPPFPKTGIKNRQLFARCDESTVNFRVFSFTRPAGGKFAGDSRVWGARVCSHTVGTE